MAEMLEVAAAIRPLDAAGMARADAALARRRTPDAIDAGALLAELEGLIRPAEA